MQTFCTVQADKISKNRVRTPYVAKKISATDQAKQFPAVTLHADSDKLSSSSCNVTLDLVIASHVQSTKAALAEFDFISIVADEATSSQDNYMLHILFVAVHPAVCQSQCCQCTECLVIKLKTKGAPAPEKLTIHKRKILKTGSTGKSRD
ncbi:hypothetical protein Y1Q_0000021 [Alligator mississippiensis]|uniref:Uncharacterized protein n=1 Tax=Alligator mississippiensis TaxID=8496 RepID=A0A151NTF2_ALLMI|nr:hypothetical protein Y1Q_0000021 [Alligator mississippiensis]